METLWDPHSLIHWLPGFVHGGGRGQLKCGSTRAETGFHLSTKRTSPFKLAGTSVQSTTGSRGVRISGSNAGYTMFRGSVKGTGYLFHSPVSPSIHLPCVTVCHHISTGDYNNRFMKLTAHLHRNSQVLNEQKEYNMSLNLFFPLWCNSPTRAQVVSLRFRDLQRLNTPPSVGLLWTRDRPVTLTSTWQHPTSITDRRACPCGIRTRNPNKRPAADLCSKTVGPLGLAHFHIIYEIFYYL